MHTNTSSQIMPNLATPSYALRGNEIYRALIESYASQCFLCVCVWPIPAHLLYTESTLHSLHYSHIMYRTNTHLHNMHRTLYVLPNGHLQWNIPVYIYGRLN